MNIQIQDDGTTPADQLPITYPTTKTTTIAKLQSVINNRVNQIARLQVQIDALQAQNDADNEVLSSAQEQAMSLPERTTIQQIQL